MILKKLCFALSLIASLGGVASAQASSDICDSWTYRPGSPVSTQTCSYPDGKSGYIVVTNEGGKADLCWTVIANDGSEDRGCHTGMGAGETARSSAYQCGTNTRHGGCRGIRLDKYQPR